MPVIWHLAISNWRIKRVRLLLLVLAVAAGSLITSAAGTLISSLGATLQHNLNLAVQNVDLTVRPAISSSGIQLPASTLEKINALQQVALCEGRITAYVTVVFNGHTAAAQALAGTWHNQSQLRPLTFVSGSALANPQEVAIDDALANRLSLHSGDKITLVGADSGTALNVSGIAASSDVARIVQPLLCYVSIDVLHRIDHSRIGWTQIDVKLRPQSNIAAVAAD